MHEARKLHLMEEVLRIKDDQILAEVEAFLERLKRSETTEKFSAHDLSGTWSKEDASLIENAIKDCEQIHPDDWK